MEDMADCTVGTAAIGENLGGARAVKEPGACVTIANWRES